MNTVQLSGLDERKRPILSVITKKSYHLTLQGNCIPQDVSLTLCDEFKFYTDCQDLLKEDLDEYPLKPFTDVVVKGEARNIQPLPFFESLVQIGSHKVSFSAIGNRKAYLTPGGKIKFTSPELIQQIPLRYDFAYGGKDLIAEKKLELPSPELTEAFSEEIAWFSISPYRYMRNPCGKGYIVEESNDSLETLELPNLEDPTDLLTPESVIVKDPLRWMEMPLPRCTDWVSPTWFPRIAYLGLFEYPQKSNRPLGEIIRHWAEGNIIERKTAGNSFNFRFTNGASLGLQLPYLKLREQITLVNIHPKLKEYSFRLPEEYPKIWVDGRNGKLLETKPVIHTIVIEPNENRLSLVWRGSAPAVRPYLEEELKTMPYKVEWKR